MKRTALLCIALASISTLFGQGRSISRRPKIRDPYVTAQNDTLRVGTVVRLLDPSVGLDYLYVMALNKLNEPIVPASSKVSGKAQPIKFFKEEDGVMYMFTDFFSINIDAATRKGEVEVVK